MITLTLTEGEVAAGLRLLNRAWIGQDEDGKSFLQKLAATAPHLCDYCFTDSRVGTHSQHRCTDAGGAEIKRT